MREGEREKEKERERKGEAKKKKSKDICRPPAPTQPRDDLTTRLAEAPSPLPVARNGAAAEQNTGAVVDGEGEGEGDGEADMDTAVAFGRLAVSPTLDREPIRRTSGSSIDNAAGERTDASE